MLQKKIQSVVGHQLHRYNILGPGNNNSFILTLFIVLIPVFYFYFVLCPIFITCIDKNAAEHENTKSTTSFVDTMLAGK